MARMILSGPTRLVRMASCGQYSHAGTCFKAAALNTMSMLRSADGREVAHVANSEFKSPFGILTDGSVSGRLGILIFEADVMLLFLIAREDDHLRRQAILPAKKAANKHLSQRTGAARDQHTLVVQDILKTWNLASRHLMAPSTAQRTSAEVGYGVTRTSGSGTIMRPPCAR